MSCASFIKLSLINIILRTRLRGKLYLWQLGLFSMPDPPVGPQIVLSGRFVRTKTALKLDDVKAASHMPIPVPFRGKRFSAVRTVPLLVL